MLFQVITYGIIIGAIYSLAGAGLALLFGVMKYLNIAHGTFIMLGGYISYWIFILLDLNPFISFPIVMAIMFLIGLIAYKMLFSSLIRACDVEQRIGNSMLITFGLMLVLNNSFTLLWTSDVRSITTLYTGQVINIYGIRLPIVGLIGFTLSLIALLCLHLFLSKTHLGKSVRATTQDWEGALLQGINIDRTFLISCGLVMAFSGLAGIVIVTSYSISPLGGMEWLLKAMIVMILAGAGEGRTNGLLAAGIFLGIIEGIGTYLLGFAYREIIALLVFVFVLMLKSKGFINLKILRS